MKKKVTLVILALIVIFSISRIDFRTTEEYYSESASDSSQLEYVEEENENSTLNGILQNSGGKMESSSDIEEDEQQSASSKKKDNIKVTIYIDLTNLLDDASQAKLKPELRKYVPSDGYPLKKTTISVSANDSVFDVLQKVTRLNKIHMEYQGANENIYNSVYIQGINHIYEFSAGSESGWMYSINGDFPNYGLSSFKVNDGDLIRVVYTTNLGCDVGHSTKKCR